MREPTRPGTPRSDVLVRLLAVRTRPAPGRARAFPAVLVALACAGCGAEAPPSGSQAALESRKETSDSPRAADEVKGPLVAFLGDSIAAGLGVRPDEAFPAVLQRELTASGLPLRLVNAGVSGDTTAGGLARLDWLLEREPRILVVELGGNDALRGQPLEGIEANLRRIVDRARERGCRVLVLGMRVPPSYGQEYAEGFASIYERLDGLDGVELVPFFMNGVGGVPGLNLPDGIHPTAKGHELLAETVLPVLRRLVEEVSD